MESATSICLEVFSSVNSFEHLRLFPTKEQLLPSQPLEISHELVNKVLFDFYSIDKEKFYLKREKDNEIISHLNYYSLWVNGKSGRGKSISLVRNLLQEKIDFIPVTLASCIGLSIDDFFYEIYVEINSKLKPNDKGIQKSNYQSIVREINKILLEFYRGKTIFIIIDEIPLGEDDKFTEFVKLICSLFISSALQSPNINIRYALSSIHSPENLIPEFQNKVRNFMCFIAYDDWNEKELNELISLIENELNIQLSIKKRELIISESNGSPRWIKNVLKNAIIIGGFDDTNIDKAIVQTKNQKVI